MEYLREKSLNYYKIYILVQMRNNFYKLYFGLLLENAFQIKFKNHMKINFQIILRNTITLYLLRLNNPKMKI